MCSSNIVSSDRLKTQQKVLFFIIIHSLKEKLLCSGNNNSTSQIRIRNEKESQTLIVFCSPISQEAGSCRITKEFISSCLSIVDQPSRNVNQIIRKNNNTVIYNSYQRQRVNESLLTMFLLLREGEVKSTDVDKCS